MKYILLVAMQISVESFCQAKLIVLETFINNNNNKIIKTYSQEI